MQSDDEGEVVLDEGKAAKRRVGPERNVLFFLACLVPSVRRFEQTRLSYGRQPRQFCAQFMIYNKETAFLLLLGFAASRLISRCRNAPHVGWGCDRLWDRETRLDLCLTALA